ncbi:hypothetical protein RR48_04693 [Papilio machaon]|uniref:Uncharacterized protein n=1 Tax=Papilio machaon TaxID=76193 RepID=A0A0N0PEC6_PAPMA|nr:hypothetical protein RR48_04693 [Papilio machaon]
MISGGWVCALHVRTAGLAGAALGSDEEEIVYLAYVVIDVLTNQLTSFCKCQQQACVNASMQVDSTAFDFVTVTGMQV